jgi:hypothetical protein
VTSDLIKNKVGDDAKFIVFGGSYPGALAAWFRAKYPHLVVGGVASSAPVHAVVEMISYNQVVGSSLRYFGGDACYDAVQKASGKVYSLLQSDNGRMELSRAFNTCQPLLGASKFDDATFESNVVGPIQGTCQYNNDKPSHATFNLDDVCDYMTKGDAYQGLVNMSALFQAGECMDISYQNMIKEMEITEFDGERSSRQWTYQVCQEFGYLQTNSAPDEPFYPLKDVNLAYFEAQCKDIFGVNALPDTSFATANYGGLDLTTTQLVIPDGSIDPWHSLAIINNTATPTMYPVFIEGTAHCADMYAPDPLDIPALVAARITIAKHVGEFLE